MCTVQTYGTCIGCMTFEYEYMYNVFDCLYVYKCEQSIWYVLFHVRFTFNSVKPIMHNIFMGWCFIIINGRNDLNQTPQWREPPGCGCSVCMCVCYDVPRARGGWCLSVSPSFASKHTTTSTLKSPSVRVCATCIYGTWADIITEYWMDIVFAILIGN